MVLALRGVFLEQMASFLAKMPFPPKFGFSGVALRGCREGVVIADWRKRVCARVQPFTIHHSLITSARGQGWLL